MLIKDKKVITIVWMAMILSVLLFIVLFVGNSVSSEHIFDVQVTNISSSSASVSWRTSEPIKGSLVYSESSIPLNIVSSMSAKKAFDDRDIEEINPGDYKLVKQGEYYLHHVTISGLDSNTQYHFRVQVNNKIVKDRTYENVLRHLTLLII
jgi:hypothetical protein